MINTEGNTLNVPELRRLLEEAQKAEKAWGAAVVAAGPPRDADFGGEMSDEDDRLLDRYLTTHTKASEAAFNAAPALLDRLVAAELVATAADNYVTLNASFDELEDAVHAYRETVEAGPS